MSGQSPKRFKKAAARRRLQTGGRKAAPEPYLQHREGVQTLSQELGVRTLDEMPAVPSPAPSFHHPEDVESILRDLGVGQDPAELPVLQASQLSDLLDMASAPEPEVITIPDTPPSTSSSGVSTMVGSRTPPPPQPAPPVVTLDDDDDEFLAQVLDPPQDDFEAPVMTVAMEQIELNSTKCVQFSIDLLTGLVVILIKGLTSYGSVTSLRLSPDELTLLITDNYRQAVETYVRRRQIFKRVHVGGILITILKGLGGSEPNIQLKRGAKSNVVMSFATWRKFCDFGFAMNHLVQKKRDAANFVMKYLDTTVQHAATMLLDDNLTLDFFKKAPDSLFVDALLKAPEEIVEFCSQLDYYLSKTMVDFTAVKNSFIMYHTSFLKIKIIEELQKMKAEK